MEPLEITIDNVKCLYLESVDLQRADLMNIHSWNKALSNDLPIFSSFYKSGTYIFVIDFNDTFPLKNINADTLSPWNLKENGRTIKTKRENIVFNGEKYACWRAKHPHLEAVKRLTIASADKAAIAYCFGNSIDFALVKLPERRTKPSDMDIVKETLEYRSVKNANTLLMKTNVQIGKNTVKNASRTVISTVKSNTGQAKVTSLDKLAAVIDAHNSKLLVNNSDKSKGIICTIIFDDALKVYAADCPSIQQLEEFKRYMEDMLSSNITPAPKLYNNSLFLPGMECQLSCDTTFDLSHLFVTLIFGKLGSYKTKNSLKDRPILLAAMLHSYKNASSHAFFGEHFAATWKKISGSKKAIPSIIKDAEIALEQIVKDRVFDTATRLHCDLHLCENILGKNSINTEKANILFGKIENGRIRNGLFQQLTMEKFHEYMEKLGNKYDEMHSKMCTREEALFRYHSRRNKLFAGFGGRYGTNNVSECINSTVKQYIPHKMPGEEVFQNLILMHLHEMREINSAATSKKVEYVKRTPFAWMSKNKETLEESTVTPADIEEEFDSGISNLFFIPFEILANISGTEQIAIKKQQGSLVTTDGPDNDYIVTSKNSEEISRVRLTDKRMTCNVPSCRSNRRYLIIPCPHILCVFRTRNECKKYWKYYENKATGLSFKDIERTTLKKTDGSKKRKGKMTSKANYKRTCYESLEADAIDSTVESLHLSSLSNSVWEDNSANTGTLDYQSEENIFDDDTPLSSYVRHPTLTESYDVDDFSAITDSY